jgi:hypothetical protein
VTFSKEQEKVLERVPIDMWSAGKCRIELYEVELSFWDAFGRLRWVSCGVGAGRSRAEFVLRRELLLSPGVRQSCKLQQRILRRRLPIGNEKIRAAEPRSATIATFPSSAQKARISRKVSFSKKC